VTEAKVKSEIQPIGDHILVIPIPEDKEMKHGTLTLVVPETAQDKPNRGTVVAVGEGRIVDGKLRPINLKPGQKVLFSKYAGNDFRLGETSYIVISHDDILVTFK
jgi:chaperonin GroES